ncbi:MAG TPA: hypothetical protein VMJ10_20065 [Kofleriaceae bacterium]|nr:hypothetical protein [Kofleriaceae bacterium]
MNDAALVASWTEDGSSLREVVERALSAALTGTDYEWYLAHRGRSSMSGLRVEARCDRYVVYPRSQPWAEGLRERHWSKRSPWPEGQFYTLDLALDSEQLVLTHSNDTRNADHNLRNLVSSTATTVSLYTLAAFILHEPTREMFERHGAPSSLEGVIRWMVETYAPNHFSAT